MRGWLKRQMRVREQGVALIAVMVAVAVIGATAADYAFNARVDYAATINSRDALRAHFLARSGINLSRMLLKVQKRLIDPNRKLFGGLDIQIADYAPMLVSAFNSKEGAASLGSLLGLDAKKITGFGVAAGTFDLEMESLDGRINLNCAGGANPAAPQVRRFASALAALMLPGRYNHIFDEDSPYGPKNAEGKNYSRLQILRAIIDWADKDEVLWDIKPSTAPEDYNYNSGDDPYLPKNDYYDTVDELRLVRGVGDLFMDAFGDSFTVYGDCKVNVSLADAPLLTAVILQIADPQKQAQGAMEALNVVTLVRAVMYIRDMLGGFRDVKAFVRAVENPKGELLKATALGNLLSASFGGETKQPSLGNLRLIGLKVKKGYEDLVTAGGSRRIWQVTATAKVGRVRRRIVAIWDSDQVSEHVSKYNSGKGGYVYWREE